ncbi:MAG TPA: hypothetical protein VHC22_14215 [Pirellulales bacterium]|nr:hypothetical protein [Pirellulales bacterium]
MPRWFSEKTGARMPAKLTKRRFSLFAAIAVGCAIGSAVSQGLFDNAPGWLSIPAGATVAVVVSLGL